MFSAIRLYHPWQLLPACSIGRYSTHLVLLRVETTSTLSCHFAGQSEQEKKRLLHTVIVGGGPTGERSREKGSKETRSASEQVPGRLMLHLLQGWSLQAS